MFQKVLIANRGEIAIRIASALADLGVTSVGVHAQDDAAALHTRRVDVAHVLPGRGPAAYLDIVQVVAAARAEGCDAVHPGYGFLSENAAFARACAEVGLVFIGPAPEVLELFGDKARARRLAQEHGVPVASGIDHAVSAAEARAFFEDLGPGAAMMVKALAGGGGRGMRVVRAVAEVDEAVARCQSEAQAAFGSGEVYVEALVERARHVEVQLIGEGSGAVSHAWERDCTLQRRHQKLVEFAPAPHLDAGVRGRLLDAAVKLGRAVRLRGLCTIEFLVVPDGRFFFMEANPRLQVEHTVTEAITGLDLVQAQLRLAAGASLAELGLTQAQMPEPRGMAVQLRVSLERAQPDGSVLPAGGTLAVYEPPAGPGIRVDGCGQAGLAPAPGYDALLAKVIVSQPQGDLAALLRRADRALAAFRLAGIQHNLGSLRALLQRPELAAYAVDTGFVQAQAAALFDAAQAFDAAAQDDAAIGGNEAASALAPVPPGCIAMPSPVHGSLVALDVAEGQPIAPGQRVAVIEAMKMEFEILAEQGGYVRGCPVGVGEVVRDGQALLIVEPAEIAADAGASAEALDLDAIRPDLAEVIARHAATLDAARPQAMAKRHAQGQRSARENVDDLLDAGSFLEYGALALANQRSRLKLADLIAQSPGDGMVAGLGTVNAQAFGEHAARCMVLAYDYTVFAGTQGSMNHKKTDRLLHMAQERQLPVVLFAEGGGGRPSDEFRGVGLLDNWTFLAMARLSGLVPTVAVVNGRCFAGNAALAGCCDVIIATRRTSIGMAGPAMIEGGGLGKVSAEDVGPVRVQAPNGVIDVVVEDEAEAVRVARQYLGYFQGRSPQWEQADQRLLRHAVPEKRTRVYDVRHAIETLCDTGSVLELRRDFAPGLVTALVRIEGRPCGLFANDPRHLGGAIDAAGGDKAARFMQLCDAFDLPLISLCDTPGFMVGPEAEKEATVRHVSRMFVTAASLTVPLFAVVLRKGYGLGAQAMTAGSFHAPVFTVAWPSAELGPMGLEGAVRLAMAKPLAAIEDTAERERLFQQMVAAAYDHGKGLNAGTYLEIDDVIDPADTRRWLARGLAAMPEPAPRAGKKRPFVDAW